MDNPKDDKPQQQSQQQPLPPEVTRLLQLAANKFAGKTRAYANNTVFEPSVWDLKIIFGELRQGEAEKLDWHTEVTVPWLQAKILAYYLQLNIAFHEQTNGSIRLGGMKPPAPEPPTEEQIKSNPRTVETFDTVTKIYADFFGE